MSFDEALEVKLSTISVDSLKRAGKNLWTDDKTENIKRRFIRSLNFKVCELL